MSIWGRGIKVTKNAMQQSPNFLRNLSTILCLVHSTFQPTVYKSSNFSSCSLTLITNITFKNHSHYNRCDVISHCGLIYILLIISDVEHLFIYLLTICVSSLEKRLFNIFSIWKIRLFIKKFEKRTIIWSSNCTSEYVSTRIEIRIRKRYLHSHVQQRVIHNSQDIEIAWVSINKRMNKESVIHIYNGILFSLTEEANSVLCDNMDEPGRRAKSSKPMTGQTLHCSIESGI